MGFGDLSLARKRAIVDFCSAARTFRWGRRLRILGCRGRRCVMRFHSFLRLSW